VVHTSVLQLTNGLPPDVGAVLWAGFSSPLTTPYIPFYFGVKNVPKPYDAKTPDEQKAAQVYQQLADLFYQSPLKSSARFPSIWNDFQEKCFNEQVKIDQGAMRLYRMQASLARHFLTVNIESLSREALYIARDEADEYQ
jgi:dipeptidase